jgi:anaphase-promoting complex subunit 4
MVLPRHQLIRPVKPRDDLFSIVTMTLHHFPAANTPRSDTAVTPAMMNIVGEKFFPARCRPRTLSYCPTMDLVAAVTTLDLPGEDQRAEEKLSVWRLNGEQVFAWNAPARLGIPFVKWKTDGRLIALGTSDGVIRLLNVMNGGKTVHCLTPSPGEAMGRSGLSCLAWTVNFGDVKGMNGLVGEEGDGSVLDDLLSLGAGKGALGKMNADLPRELACGIDVETSIPKLSLLPSGTGAGGGWGFGGAGGE